MKFLALAFIAGAIATPAAVKRQAATGLVDSIAAIQSATTSLNTAISSGDLLALASGNSAVVDAIKAATTEAEGLSELSFNDAASLANPIQELGKVVETTINNLISKADSLSGVREAVLAGLESQQTASAAFSAALLSKIPENLQGIAQNLAKPIADNLARGVAAFSGAASSSSSAAVPSSTYAPPGYTTSPAGYHPTTYKPMGSYTSSAPGGSYTQSPPLYTPPTPAGSYTRSAPGGSYTQSAPGGSYTQSAPGGSYAASATGGGSYVVPTVTKITGIPSYSFPGSTPTPSSSQPAAYTGAAAPVAKPGMLAAAAAVMVAAVAF